MSRIFAIFNLSRFLDEAIDEFIGDMLDVWLLDGL